MSLANELLDSLTENQTETRAIDPTTEPHIVIHPNRDVYVPDELKEIAVQYEHNIKTVTFDCPRYWDGHDLLDLTIYVNYERKDKVRGRYPVDNVRVDESDESLIHFDWTISGHVTEAFGDLTILACAKSVDDEGYEQEHWNSHRNEEMTVAEGLECSDAASEQYPDEIAVILGKIGKLEKHTHTAEDVGALPKEGDPEASVEVKSLTATDIQASDRVTILNSQASHVNLINQSDGQKSPILVFEGEEDNDPVILRNIREPENSNDAANMQYVDDLEKFLSKRIDKEGVKVSGAEVGQVLKVAEVDENGVPTAWISANAEEKWEEIINYTLPENATGILMTEDKNGNPFDLKKAFVFVYHLPELLEDGTYVSCQAGIALFNPYKVNHAYRKAGATEYMLVAESSSAVHFHGLCRYYMTPSASADGNVINILYAERIGETAMHAVCQSSKNGSSWLHRITTVDRTLTKQTLFPETGDLDIYTANDKALWKEFCSIKTLAVGSLDGHFGAGSIFRMYGIRK